MKRKKTNQSEDMTRQKMQEKRKDTNGREEHREKSYRETFFWSCAALRLLRFTPTKFVKVILRRFEPVSNY